ncbi:MAG: hypothetical protein WC329_04005, partial [Candidatus Omnitrophota bacterium]
MKFTSIADATAAMKQFDLDYQQWKSTYISGNGQDVPYSLKPVDIEKLVEDSNDVTLQTAYEAFSKDTQEMSNILKAVNKDDPENAANDTLEQITPTDMKFTSIADATAAMKQFDLDYQQWKSTYISGNGQDIPYSLKPVDIEKLVEDSNDVTLQTAYEAFSKDTQEMSNILKAVNKDDPENAANDTLEQITPTDMKFTSIADATAAMKQFDLDYQQWKSTYISGNGQDIPYSLKPVDVATLVEKTGNVRLKEAYAMFNSDRQAFEDILTAINRRNPGSGADEEANQITPRNMGFTSVNDAIGVMQKFHQDFQSWKGTYSSIISGTYSPSDSSAAFSQSYSTETRYLQECAAGIEQGLGKILSVGKDFNTVTEELQSRAAGIEQGLGKILSVGKDFNTVTEELQSRAAGIEQGLGKILSVGKDFNTVTEELQSRAAGIEQGLGKILSVGKDFNTVTEELQSRAAGIENGISQLLKQDQSYTLSEKFSGDVNIQGIGEAGIIEPGVEITKVTTVIAGEVKKVEFKAYSTDDSTGISQEVDSFQVSWNNPYGGAAMTFDINADGTMIGEGSGMFVLNLAVPEQAEKDSASPEQPAQPAASTLEVVKSLGDDTWLVNAQKLTAIWDSDSPRVNPFVEGSQITLAPGISGLKMSSTQELASEDGATFTISGNTPDYTMGLLGLQGEFEVYNTKTKETTTISANPVSGTNAATTEQKADVPADNNVQSRITYITTSAVGNRSVSGYLDILKAEDGDQVYYRSFMQNHNASSIGDQSYPGTTIVETRGPDHHEQVVLLGVLSQEDAQAKVSSLEGRESDTLNIEDGIYSAVAITKDSTWTLQLNVTEHYDGGKSREQLIAEGQRDPQPVSYTYGYSTTMNGVSADGWGYYKQFSGYVNYNDPQLKVDITSGDKGRPLAEIQGEAPQFVSGSKYYALNDGKQDSNNYASYGISAEGLSAAYFKEGMPMPQVFDLAGVPESVSDTLWQIQVSSSKNGQPGIHTVTSGDDSILPPSSLSYSSMNAADQAAYRTNYNQVMGTQLDDTEFADRWDTVANNLQARQFSIALQTGNDPVSGSEQILSGYFVTLDPVSQTIQLTYYIEGVQTVLGSGTYSIEGMTLGSITLDSLGDRHISGSKFADTFENGAIRHSEISWDNIKTTVDYDSTDKEDGVTVRSIVLNQYNTAYGADYRTFSYTAYRTYSNGVLSGISEKTYVPQTKVQITAGITQESSDSTKKFSLLIIDPDNRVTEVTLKNGINELAIPNGAQVMLKYYEPADDEDGGRAQIAVTSINGQAIDAVIKDPGYNRNSAQTRTLDITADVLAATTGELQEESGTERQYQHGVFGGEIKLISAVVDYYNYGNLIEKGIVTRTFDPVTGNQLTNRQEQWRVDGIIPMEVTIVVQDTSKNSIVVKDADGVEISRQLLTPGQNNIFIDKPDGAKVYFEMVTGSPVSVGSMKVDGETVALGSEVNQPSRSTTGAKTITRDITEAVNVAADSKLHLQSFSEERFAYNDENKLSGQTVITGGKSEDNKIMTSVAITSGIGSSSPLVTSASFNGLLTDTDKLIAVTAEPASGTSSHPDYASLLIDKGVPQAGSGTTKHYEYVDNQYSYFAIEVKSSEVSTSWPFAGLTIETSAFTNFKENVLTVNRTVLGYENVYNIGLGPFRYDLTGVEVNRETGADISGGKLNGLERINGGERITISDSDDKGTIGYFDSALQYHTYVSGVGDVTVNLAGQISSGKYVYMPQLMITRTNLYKHGNDQTNLPGGAEEWQGPAILDIISGRTYFDIDNPQANFGNVEEMPGDSKNTTYNQFAYKGTGYLPDDAAALYSQASAILTQTQAVKNMIPWLFGTGYAYAYLGNGMDDGDPEAYCLVKPITGGKEYYFGTNKNTGFYLGGYSDLVKGMVQIFAEKQGPSAEGTTYLVLPSDSGQLDMQQTLTAAEELGLNLVDGTRLQDNPLFQFVAGMMPGGIYPTATPNDYTNNELTDASSHTYTNSQTGEVETIHYTERGNVITNAAGKVISATVPGKNPDGSSSLRVWSNPEYPGNQQQQNSYSAGSSIASQWLAEQIEGKNLASRPISSLDISGLTPAEPGTVTAGGNPSDQHNVIKAGFNPVESLSGLYSWAKGTWVGQQVTNLVYSEKTETDGKTTTSTGSLFNIIPWNSKTTFSDPEAGITEVESSHALGFDKSYSYYNGLTRVFYSKQESYFGFSSSEDFKSDSVKFNINSWGIFGIGAGSGSFNDVPVTSQSTLNGEKFTPSANAGQVVIQLNKGTSEEGGNSWEIREYNKNGELQEAFSYDFGGGLSSSNSLVYSGMQKTAGDEGTGIYSASVLKTEQTGETVTKSVGIGSVGIKNDNSVQPVSSFFDLNKEVYASGQLREKTRNIEWNDGLSYKENSILPSGGIKAAWISYLESSLNPNLEGKHVFESALFSQTFNPDGQIADQRLTNYVKMVTGDSGALEVYTTANEVKNRYTYPNPKEKTVVNNYQNTNVRDNMRGTVVPYSEGTATSKYDDLNRLNSYRVVTGPVAVQDLSSAGSQVIFYGKSDNTDTYSYIGGGNDVDQHGFIYKDYDYINGEAISKEGNEKFNAYNAAGSVSDKNSLQDTKVYGLNDHYSADPSDLRLWTGEASHEWNIAQNGNVKSMDYDNWDAVFVDKDNKDDENTITHTTGHSDITANELGLSVDVKDKGKLSAYEIKDAVSLQKIFNGGDSVAAFTALTSSGKDYLGPLTAQKSYEDHQFAIEHDRLDRPTAYKYEIKIDDKLDSSNSGILTGDWNADYTYKATGKTVNGFPVVQTIQVSTTTGGKETETAQSAYKDYDFSSLTGPVTMDTVPSVEARSLSYSQLSMQADTAGGWFYNNVAMPVVSAAQSAWDKTVAPAWNYLNDNVVEPAGDYLNNNIVNPIVNWGSEPQQVMVFGGKEITLETLPSPSNWDRAWGWWVENVGGGNPTTAQQAAIGTGIVVAAPVVVYAGTTATGAAAISYAGSAAGSFITRPMAKRIITDAVIGHGGILAGRETYSLITDGKLYTPGLNDFGYNLDNPNKLEGIVAPFVLNIAMGELGRAPLEMAFGAPLTKSGFVRLSGWLGSKPAAASLPAARTIGEGIPRALLQLPKDMAVSGIVFAAADNICNIAIEGSYLNGEQALASFENGMMLGAAVRFAALGLGTLAGAAGTSAVLARARNAVVPLAESNTRSGRLISRFGSRMEKPAIWGNNIKERAIAFGWKQPETLPISFRTTGGFVAVGPVYTAVNLLGFDQSGVRSKIYDALVNNKGSLSAVLTDPTIIYSVDQDGNPKYTSVLQYAAMDTANFAKMSVYLPTFLGIAAVPHTITTNKALQAFATGHSFQNLGKILKTSLKGGSYDDIIISNLAKREAAGQAAGFGINSIENAAFVATTLGVNNNIFYTAFKALGFPEQEAQTWAGHASFISLIFLPVYSGTRITAQQEKAVTDLLTGEGYSEVQFKRTADPLVYAITVQDKTGMPVELESRLSVSAEQGNAASAIVFPKTEAGNDGIRVLRLSPATTSEVKVDRENTAKMAVYLAKEVPASRLTEEITNSAADTVKEDRSYVAMTKYGLLGVRAGEQIGLAPEMLRNEIAVYGVKQQLKEQGLSNWELYEIASGKTVDMQAVPFGSKEIAGREYAQETATIGIQQIKDAAKAVLNERMYTMPGSELLNIALNGVIGDKQMKVNPDTDQIIGIDKNIQEIAVGVISVRSVFSGDKGLLRDYIEGKDLQVESGKDRLAALQERIELRMNLGVKVESSLRNDYLSALDDTMKIEEKVTGRAKYGFELEPELKAEYKAAALESLTDFNNNRPAGSRLNDWQLNDLADALVNAGQPISFGRDAIRINAVTPIKQLTQAQVEQIYWNKEAGELAYRPVDQAQNAGVKNAVEIFNKDTAAKSAMNDLMDMLAKKYQDGGEFDFKRLQSGKGTQFTEILKAISGGSESMIQKADTGDGKTAVIIPISQAFLALLGIKSVGLYATEAKARDAYKEFTDLLGSGEYKEAVSVVFVGKDSTSLIEQGNLLDSLRKSDIVILDVSTAQSLQMNTLHADFKSRFASVSAKSVYEALTADRWLFADEIQEI